MPAGQTAITTTVDETPKKYQYETIKDLYQLTEPSGAKWCFYGVVKFRRQVNSNCILLGLCDPTSYGKGPKGVSCLLYRESFAGMIELPVQVEVGHLIRLHRMKITNYRPESGCLQLKSSNYYSWLVFDGKDDTSYDPIAQSSYTYSFSDEDCHQIDQLRRWLVSFGDDETLHTELDFQFVLPVPKSYAEQWTQTNDEGPRPVTAGDDNSPSCEFHSALDEIEPAPKRPHVQFD